jgi:hypothetical protein
MKKLQTKQIFEIADKLAVAYASAFSATTIAKAIEYTEGQPNPSRNYVYGILINTKTKNGSIAERFTVEDSRSIVKLAIYKLANPRVAVASIDI